MGFRIFSLLPPCVFLALAQLTFLLAQETSSSGSGFHLTKGYSVSASVSPNGLPRGAGGRAGPSDGSNNINTGGEGRMIFPYMNVGAADPSLMPVSGSTFGSIYNISSYLVALVSVYYAITYLFSLFFGTPMPALKAESEKGESKERKRRSIEKNEELTRLVSMVMSAVESEDCLQKTICMLGSQLGSNAKGKFAVSLAQTLAPENIQKNQYFVTLRNSLLKKSYCSRFVCKSNNANAYYWTPENE